MDKLENNNRVENVIDILNQVIDKKTLENAVEKFLENLRKYL